MFLFWVSLRRSTGCCRQCLFSKCCLQTAFDQTQAHFTSRFGHLPDTNTSISHKYNKLSKLTSHLGHSHVPNQRLRQGAGRVTKRNYFRIPFRAALDGRPGSAIRLSGNSGQVAPGENSKLCRRVMLRLSVGYPPPPFFVLDLRNERT